MSRRAKILCLASLVLFSGCVHQQGRNDQCRWSDEAARILNLRNATDQDHLRDDAQFAEELAVRYADRRAHDIDEYRKHVADCTGNLFAHIAVLHNIDVGAVSQAAFKRNRMADFALVYLPISMLFALFTYRQCSRIFLGTDSISAVLIVLFVTSILASGCGVLIGEFWAIGVETLRVGNGHLSFRTGRIPWSNERIYLFVIGLGLFWITAALRYWHQDDLARDPLLNSRRTQLGLNE